MNNSYENLPEEYENDGNTYCHGIVNCKYNNEGECIFYAMGSGNPDDMPCISQANSDIKAFQEWREKQEIEQTKALEERPQSDLISREALLKEVRENKELYEKERVYLEGLLLNAPAVEPDKVLFANVTFDEDKLKDLVQTEVIDKIKNGELVIKDERPQGEWKLYGMIYYCSNCGHDCGESGDNYCGNCGADMRGDTND